MAGIRNRIPFGISDNNNNRGLHKPWGGPPNHHIPAERHCKILEVFIKTQNAELSQKKQTQEEMRSLIDWLKKDLREAEERVRTLERETGQQQEDEEVEKENGQGHEQEEKDAGKRKDGREHEEKKSAGRRKEGEEVDQEVQEKRRGEYGENEELETLQDMLLEKNERISKMAETIANYEREIDDLRRENETYFAQVKTLRSTIERQTQDLKKDTRVEKEVEKRLKDLLAVSEKLNAQLDSHIQDA